MMNPLIDTVLSKQLFLFDLDGTLADLEQLNFHSFQKAIESCSSYTFTWEEYQKYFSGNGSLRGFELYSVDHPNVNKCASDMQKVYRDIKYSALFNEFAANVKIVPYAREFLELLKSKGKQIVLATATSREFANKIITELQIDIFDKILTEESVKHRKPDPEIYLLAMKEMATAPENTVVFEDSLKGLRAAKASRAFVVQVHTTAMPNQDANADIAVKDYGIFLGN